MRSLTSSPGSSGEVRRQVVGWRQTRRRDHPHLSFQPSGRSRMDLLLTGCSRYWITCWWVTKYTSLCFLATSVIHSSTASTKPSWEINQAGLKERERGARLVA